MKTIILFILSLLAITDQISSKPHDTNHTSIRNELEVARLEIQKLTEKLAILEKRYEKSMEHLDRKDNELQSQLGKLQSEYFRLYNISSCLLI